MTVILRAHSLSARTTQLRFIVRGTRGSYIKYGVDPQEDQLKVITTPESILEDGYGKEPESSWGVLETVREDNTTFDRMT